MAPVRRAEYTEAQKLGGRPLTKVDQPRESTSTKKETSIS